MPTFFLQSPNHFVRPDNPPPGARSKTVWLIGETGTTLALPLAPSLSHDGLAPAYNVEPRVGRKPLLTKTGPVLRTYTYTLTLIGRNRAGYLDGQELVERQLQILRALARSGERVSWKDFGPSEGGQFRITQLSVTDVRRKHMDNGITHAIVQMSLTEASDPTLRVGPLTGGAEATPKPSSGEDKGPGHFVRPDAPESPVPGATGTTNQTEKTYTVVKGDTLSSIALRFLGSASRYRELADWNNITNPNLIQIGQVLRLYPTQTHYSR